jgi:hypothetical protein
MSLVVDPALQTLRLQFRVDFRRPKGAIRPQLRGGVVRIENVIHCLGVVHCRIRHFLTPQLVPASRIDMVLVAAGASWSAAHPVLF